MDDIRPPKSLRLAREDYPGAPAWFTQFLERLNPFVGDTGDAVTQLAGKGRQVETKTITTSANTSDTFASGRVWFPNKLGYAPTSVSIGACIPKTVTTYAVDAWHEVGATGEPAFAGLWANFGAPWETVGFRMDPFGMVEVKGFAALGTGDVFTLPELYRPAAGIHLPAAAWDGATLSFGALQIKADGTVHHALGSTTGFSVRAMFRSVAYPGLGPFGPPLWTLRQGDRITIDYLSGLSANTEYAITFVIE